MSNANVDTPISDYTSMTANWEMVEALRGGTDAMRSANVKFLPKEAAESQEAYEQRLKRSYLFEGYKRALETLVGRPMMETVSFTGKMAEDIQDWLNDVDLHGTDINSFTREVFDSAMHFGLSHILVDYPRTGGPLRLDIARKSNIRPYAVHITAPDVIAWRTEMTQHREMLVHLRIKRSRREADGEWGVKDVEQIYVYDLNYDPERQERLKLSPEQSFVLMRVYEKDGDGKWQMVGEPERLTIPEIPLVTVYSTRTGFMTGKPALLGVAHLNVAHWQSNSDQRNILHVCRVPILFGRNLATRTTNDGEEILDFEIGPNRLIHSTEEDSELKYVEHTGAAIEAGAKDLDMIKEEMALLALEVMTKRTGNVTATEKAIDSAAASGALVGMVRALQTGLNKMMRLMGLWAKREDYGLVDLNTDFRIATDNSDLETLFKARINGDLSVETFWNECLRRGVLSEDFDTKDEIKRIEKEKEDVPSPLPPLKDEEEEEEEEEEEAA